MTAPVLNAESASLPSTLDAAPASPAVLVTASGSLAKVRKDGTCKGVALAPLVKSGKGVAVCLVRRSAEAQTKLSDKTIARCAVVAATLQSAGIEENEALDRAFAVPRLVVGKGDKALKVSPSSLLGRALLKLEA